MENECGCAGVYFNKLKQKLFLVTFHSDDLCSDHVIFSFFSTKENVFQLLHSNIIIGVVSLSAKEVEK